MRRLSQPALAFLSFAVTAAGISADARWRGGNRDDAVAAAPADALATSSRRW